MNASVSSGDSGRLVLDGVMPSGHGQIAAAGQGGTRVSAKVRETCGIFCLVRLHRKCRESYKYLEIRRIAPLDRWVCAIPQTAIEGPVKPARTIAMAFRAQPRSSLTPAHTRWRSGPCSINCADGEPLRTTRSWIHRHAGGLPACRPSSPSWLQLPTPDPQASAASVSLCAGLARGVDIALTCVQHPLTGCVTWGTRLTPKVLRPRAAPYHQQDKGLAPFRRAAKRIRHFRCRHSILISAAWGWPSGRQRAGSSRVAIIGTAP